MESAAPTSGSTDVYALHYLFVHVVNPMFVFHLLLTIRAGAFPSAGMRWPLSIPTDTSKDFASSRFHVTKKLSFRRSGRTVLRLRGAGVARGGPSSFPDKG